MNKSVFCLHLSQGQLWVCDLLRHQGCFHSHREWKQAAQTWWAAIWSLFWWEKTVLPDQLCWPGYAKSTDATSVPVTLNPECCLSIVLMWFTEDWRYWLQFILILCAHHKLNATEGCTLWTRSKNSETWQITWQLFGGGGRVAYFPF